MPVFLRMRLMPVLFRILCYNHDSATTLAPAEQNIYRTKINKQQETPSEFYIYEFQTSSATVSVARMKVAGGLIHGTRGLPPRQPQGSALYYLFITTAPIFLHLSSPARSGYS